MRLMASLRLMGTRFIVILFLLGFIFIVTKVLYYTCGVSCGEHNQQDYSQKWQRVLYLGQQPTIAEFFPLIGNVIG